MTTEDFYDLKGCRAERDALRKAALVVLSAIAFTNDEASADELRHAVIDYTKADSHALEIWLDVLRALKRAK